MTINFSSLIVLTRLPKPWEKPNPFDHCTETKLPSGRTVVEHVWGHAATPDTPCCCGAVRLSEVDK